MTDTEETTEHPSTNEVENRIQRLKRICTRHDEKCCCDYCLQLQAYKQDLDAYLEGL